MQASVIITTYNWPSALTVVLNSLTKQTYTNFEIIIADDGSDERTKKVIDYYSDRLNIIHVWQEDEGFRAARARNLAIEKARAPLIIFIDGDCAVPANFVSTHVKMFDEKYFTVGSRVLCSQSFTDDILVHGQITNWSLLRWHWAAIKGKINRASSLWRLPLGPLRKTQPTKWKGAKTCHLAVPRRALLAVGGFDEVFQGWGFEDSDLVVRLINYGLRRKSCKFATFVWHLWHKEASRDNAQNNLARLNLRIASRTVQAEQGLRHGCI